MKQTFNSSVLATIRRAGLKAHVWTNIRMASNTSMVTAEDPLMDYRLFNDSLQRDAKGRLLPCWCGFSVNHSAASASAAAAAGADGALPAGSCGSATVLLATRCDGHSDATHALQAALVACAELGEALALPPGSTCLSYPLVLPSNLWLQLPAGATLKAAGPLSRWPNCSWPASSFDAPLHTCKPNATGDAGMPFLRALPGARNLTITGAGTIDGSGGQWWTPPATALAGSDRGGVGYHGPPRRPYVIHMPSSSGVLLQNFLILNGPAWHADLGGSDYRIFGAI